MKKRTKTNHEFPQVRQASTVEQQFLYDEVMKAEIVPSGVYEVARVGAFWFGERPSFMQTTDHVIYRLPDELRHWAGMTVIFGVNRMITFPCEVEFGQRSDKSYFAEFVI